MEAGLPAAIDGVEREFKIVIDVRRIGQPLFYTALAGTTPTMWTGCGGRAM